MKTIHVRVEGRVQGVFFRDYTRKQAVTLNLNGWVKNMPDGSVEAVFNGADNNISDIVTWLYSGSPQSSVTNVTINDHHDIQHFYDFRIIF